MLDLIAASEAFGDFAPELTNESWLNTTGDRQLHLADSPSSSRTARSCASKHRTLRASICPSGEHYCRERVLPVDL